MLPLSWVKAFWVPMISVGAQAIGLRERSWVASEVSKGIFLYIKVAIVTKMGRFGFMFKGGDLNTMHFASCTINLWPVSTLLMSTNRNQENIISRIVVKSQKSVVYGVKRVVCISTPYVVSDGQRGKAVK